MWSKLVLYGALVVAPVASSAAVANRPGEAGKRRTQDLEESIFDDYLCVNDGTTCPNGLCPPGVVTNARNLPTITAQTSPTDVTVTFQTGYTAVWLENTYGTVITCYSPDASKCPPVAGAIKPSTCTGSTCELSWEDCWHKDVATSYHMASEAIESVIAVANYETGVNAGPGGACRSQTVMSSLPMKTWAYKVGFYENEVLDEAYVTSEPWEATDAQIAQMTPTLSPAISADSRTATVRMERLAGLPVPFLYVKDTDDRVLWYMEFSTAEQGSTNTYTSGSFAIPPVSTALEACYPASIYQTQCSSVNLETDILDTVAAPSATLPASRGTYAIKSTGDTYKVTPLPADYAACTTTYMLYAVNTPTVPGGPTPWRGPAIGGISVAAPLTLTLSGSSLVKITVFMVCGSTVSSMVVDLVNEKAAAPPEGDGSVSGDRAGSTPLTCGEYADKAIWDCETCGSGQCICEEGRTICYGSMPAGEVLTSEEAVGIAIAVIVIVVIMAFLGFFFYKKRRMMIAKATELDLGSVEGAPPPPRSPGGTELEMNKV